MLDGTPHSLTRTLLPWRDVLSIPVADLDTQAALGFLNKRIATKVYTPVAFLNANNANIAIEDPSLDKILNHFIILSDGIGVDIASWMLHGAMFKANLNGTDFVPALLASNTSSLKIGLIGARPEVVATARGSFAKQYPQHDFSVVSDGFFKIEDEPKIREKLIASRPDIVLVAMGVPRQEQFIVRLLSGETCTMPIAVGALFDLHTGSVPRAPEWMRTTRTEWIYRLWREPKRLWRRYAVGNPLFLLRVMRCKMTGTSKDKGAALAPDLVDQQL
jgi:exopolysaccharide biosynthesis WecB/TagA/CpsF family protein